MSADLTTAERAGWGEKLESWQGQLAEYGLEDTLTAAATRQAKRSAVMLARLGRADEAVAHARQHVLIPLGSLIRRRPWEVASNVRSSA